MTTTLTEKKMINFSEGVRLGLDEALATDDSVFLLGEDIADEEGGGTFRATAGLSSRYGTDRVRTTPISEQAIVGAAVGAAIAGMRPVAEIMLMNFIAVAMDQIYNHAAKIRYMSGGQTAVPLTIRTATGAGRASNLPGGGFGAQHSDMLEAWLAHSPGLKVAIPSSPSEAKGLLLSCIFDDDPCVFVESTQLYMGGKREPAPEPGYRIPLGRARTVRPGSDVTVISYGRALVETQAVVEKLAEAGTDVELIDLRTISPLDEATVLESVARTGRAVIVHEAVKRYGVGAELSSRIHEELFGQLRAPVQRVASAFTPVPFAISLEKAYLFSREDIARAIERTDA
jgi:pyruvate dehydrogenase E1 component beta subunit